MPKPISWDGGQCRRQAILGIDESRESRMDDDCKADENCFLRTPLLLHLLMVQRGEGFGDNGEQSA